MGVMVRGMTTPRPPVLCDGQGRMTPGGWGAGSPLSPERRPGRVGLAAVPVAPGAAEPPPPPPGLPGSIAEELKQGHLCLESLRSSEPANACWHRPPANAGTPECGTACSPARGPRPRLPPPAQGRGRPGPGGCGVRGGAWPGWAGRVAAAGCVPLRGSVPTCHHVPIVSSPAAALCPVEWPYPELPPALPGVGSPLTPIYLLPHRQCGAEHRDCSPSPRLVGGRWW